MGPKAGTPKSPAGRKKPATTPESRKKAAPKKKKGEAEEAQEAEETDDVDYGAQGEDDDMDYLAAKVRSTLAIKTFFHHDRKQGLPFVVWSWMDAKTGVWFTSFRVELLGTTLKSHVSPKIIENGNAVRVRVEFPDGGETANPAHFLKLYEKTNIEYGEGHAHYTAFASGLRAWTDAIDSDDEDVPFTGVELLIKLPFQCNASGFIDPITDSTPLHIGVFPLNEELYPQEANCPKPSAKFLHMHCEELHKPKAKQDIASEGFF